MKENIYPSNSSDDPLIQGFALAPLEVVKLKINGVCLNSCCFCHFHNDRQILSHYDVVRFFQALKREDYRLIVINGGEPTLHPEFLKISDFLRDHFKGRKKLQLGTNLRIFEKMNRKRHLLLQTMLVTYDRISVGCDLEHRNIDILEYLAPVILANGLELSITTISGYYDSSLLSRLEQMARMQKVTLRISPINHIGQGEPIRTVKTLCALRRNALLINCDGKAYFCFEQEFAEPAFQLSEIEHLDLEGLVYNNIPMRPYNFCSYCLRYIPESLATQGLSDNEVTLESS
ncbi:MAG TPA: hypothetical protein PKW95_23315 [bacterium]|nr:hypothetical protein [bacterium]